MPGRPIAFAPVLALVAGLLTILCASTIGA